MGLILNFFNISIFLCFFPLKFVTAFCYIDFVSFALQLSNGVQYLELDGHKSNVWLQYLQKGGLLFVTFKTVRWIANMGFKFAYSKKNVSSNPWTFSIIASSMTK